MLRQRVFSAVLLLPPVLVTAWLGGWWFTGLVAVFVALATWELCRLLSQTGETPLTPLAIILAAALVLEGGLPPHPVRPTVVLVVGVLVGLVIMLFRHTPHPASEWTLTLGAAVYVGLTMRFLAQLRGLPDGFGWLATAVLTTWLADSGAYFIGRSLGRHKLWPRISPHKTWEGFFAGVAVGLLAGMALTPWLIPGLDWRHGLLIGLTVSLAGPLGDLSESVYKRQVGAKDSSHLIPGHGGFLDRIDSFLFVGPCVYLLALAITRWPF